MKKLAVLLILAMCFSYACAEQNPVLSFDKYVSWIGDSNLLEVYGEDAYYIADLSGNKLTKEIYYSGFQHKNGLVSAIWTYGDKINHCGVLDMHGNEVVPFEYGDIKMYDGKWVVAVKLKEATHDQYDYSTWTTDDVYLIVSVDIYNINTGAKMSLNRENYERSEGYDSIINIKDRATGRITSYDENLMPIGEAESIYERGVGFEPLNVFSKGNKYGVKKGEKIIVDPCYDSYFSYNYGYARVPQNGKFGLIDEQGVMILPAEYDDILTSYYLPVTEGETGYNSRGYYAVVVDGKLGYATTEGITCEPKYAVSNMKNNGASALYTNSEGKQSIIAADGVESSLVGFESVYCLKYSGGFVYEACDENDKYALIDWHGNEVFPCQYNGFELSGDGKYVIVKEGYNKYEVYDLNMVWNEVKQANEDTSIVGLLVRARELYDRDPAAAVELIDDAIELFASGNSAVNLLQGAKELIKTDAVAYEDAISLLLNSVVENLSELEDCR